VLLMSGANVNHQDVRGWSALHLAHFSENDAIIQALSVSHPDLSLVNDDGKTAEQLTSLRASVVTQ
jgi:ankyrin repeat protein